VSELGLRSARVLALVLAAACRASTPASEAPASTTALRSPLAAVDFLVGTWIADTPEGRVTEEWAHEGDALVGRSETVANETQSFHEDLRIESRAGTLVYLASPMGRTPPTEFRRTDDGANAMLVVFENPAHDYPKRIRYERDGDRLIASIEGDGPGATWAYRRATPP
jgi:hypothetical protein